MKFGNEEKPVSQKEPFTKTKHRACHSRQTWQDDFPFSSLQERGCRKTVLFGLWLSLVERAVRVGEVQGSNPCSPIAWVVCYPISLKRADSLFLIEVKELAMQIF
jgi:hypothetical protein